MIGQTIGHFQVLAKLGAGGMGEVYLAEDTRLHRKVALKFLSAGLAAEPQAGRRLLREARAAAALNHPNIVTIYDVIEHAGQIFIAMENLEGRTLRELMGSPGGTAEDRPGSGPVTCTGTAGFQPPGGFPGGGPLPPAMAVDIVRQIAAGLAAAHGKGVIHRDVKPENIMACQSGQVKICDFGVARLTAAGHPAGTGSIRGTPAYMAPEHLLGREACPADDLWSLGMVFYELLTGRLPCPDLVPPSNVYGNLFRQPEPETDAIPEGLRTIISRCLAKDSGLRPASAGELIRWLDDYTGGRPAPAGTGAPVRIPSIAVLPFANLSNDPENEYFGDGLAEDLINALVQISGLRVVARTSSFAFKGRGEDIRKIGQLLNVQHLLEGSVRRSGRKLRITVQLVEAAGGFHLWSEQFDREWQDIFAIQDEITAAITRKLQLNLLNNLPPAAPARPGNLDAWDLYLRGRHLAAQLTTAAMQQAIGVFQQMCTLEPSSALARAGIAGAYYYLGYSGAASPHEVFPQARQAALDAIALDPGLAAAHCWLGRVLIHYDWDWPRAEAELQLALRLNPREAETLTGYGTWLMATGRLPEAREELALALSLDPRSRHAIFNFGLVLLRSGRVEESIPYWEKLQDLGYLPYAQWMLGHTRCLRGDFTGGLPLIREGLRVSGRNQLILAGLAWCLARTGQREEALAIAAGMEIPAAGERVRPYLLGKIYTGLEDRDGAFAWLDQAWHQHDPSLAFILTDETMTGLHGDPRFADLLARLNLPPGVRLGSGMQT